MPGSLHVRPVRRADARAVRGIYAPYVIGTHISFEVDPPDDAEMERRIEDLTRRHPWLVCEVDGVVTGYVYATDFRRRHAYASTRETTVYVDMEHQGRGIGRALMTALIEELRQVGARLLVAVIALPNPASVGLHETLGFRHVGVLHDVGHKFGRWHDESIWERRLVAGVGPNHRLDGSSSVDVPGSGA